MSNYSQSTFFAPKDNLATGNPNKIIYGSDIDAELSAISTAIATKAETLDLTATTTDIIPDVDNNNDIGSATKRWADLYLSGGVYIGGTTSANYLDDYEKGTFTLNVGGSYLVPLSGTVTSYYAEYVKIGCMVHVFGQINGSSLQINSGTGTGYLIFGSGCLPFSTTSDGGQSPNDTFTGVVGDGSGYGLTSAGSRTASVSAAYIDNWSWGPTSFSGFAINAVCTYMTDS